MSLLFNITSFILYNLTKLLLKKIVDGTEAPILWTDEKLFTVEAVHNHQMIGFGSQM